MLGKGQVGFSVHREVCNKRLHLEKWLVITGHLTSQHHLDEGLKELLRSHPSLRGRWEDEGDMKCGTAQKPELQQLGQTSESPVEALAWGKSS